MKQQNRKEHLPDSIKRYRKNLNLTQEALAERMGYTKQTISNWETGKNYPSDEDIERLSEIFGADSDTLLKRVPRTHKVPELKLIELFPIPNKVFTYALLFKDNVNNLWTAWIYDMDYPTMLFSGYSCSIHDNYASFKEDFLKDIDERINIARDFMDSRDISEYAQNVRDAKAMIEQMEAFADNPEAFLENE